ncbi:hypothetical protein AURDEDRAFT_113093 [Auricularia subglabra TFB-10046 SS5]|nr:hypothetical protein AURDEDRAFT_113093 [Auricularia subglabra TFB-10046 SS5]
MSLVPQRLLARSFTSTASRSKKIGWPDKAARAAIKQDQDQKNRDRANAARQARARGDDWTDSGYQPLSARLILDRKRGPRMFNPVVPDAPKHFRGRLPAFDGYKELGAEQLVVGKGAFFRNTAKDPVPVFGTPRSLEHDFALLSRPASVIRQCTLDLFQLLDGTHNDQSSVRKILAGPGGCGKSYTLLQAVEYASRNGWMVVYVPRAIGLVSDTSEYAYDRRTQTFVQPAASRTILSQILEVNTHLRRTIPGHVYRTVEKAIEEPATAPEALEALLVALGAQSNAPVLIAVDEMQALYSTSWYKDPHYKPIEACHLSVPRLLLEFASGRRALTRGAFLGAYSSLNTHFPLPLVLREAAGVPHDRPEGPYSKRPEHLLTYTEGLDGFQIPPTLTPQEGIAIYELWQNAQAVPAAYTDRTFVNAFNLSSGNPRDFVKNGLLSAMEV